MGEFIELVVSVNFGTGVSQAAVGRGTEMVSNTSIVSYPQGWRINQNSFSAQMCSNESSSFGCDAQTLTFIYRDLDFDAKFYLGGVQGNLFLHESRLLLTLYL